MSTLLITQLKPLRAGALGVESGFHFHDDLCTQNYEMEFQKFYIKSKKQKPTPTYKKTLNV